MAQEQARAERIDRLKQERPGLTWEAIADYCGVTLRSAQAWRQTGGISYGSAKKLGELFQVDPLYILHGEVRDDEAQTQLDRIERNQEDIKEMLEALLRAPGDASLPAPPDRLLQRRTAAQPRRGRRSRAKSA